jgi:hypothetical protein
MGPLEKGPVIDYNHLLCASDILISFFEFLHQFHFISLNPQFSDRIFIV